MPLADPASNGNRIVIVSQPEKNMRPAIGARSASLGRFLRVRLFVAGNEPRWDESHKTKNKTRNGEYRKEYREDLQEEYPEDEDSD